MYCDGTLAAPTVPLGKGLVESILVETMWKKVVDRSFEGHCYLVSFVSGDMCKLAGNRSTRWASIRLRPLDWTLPIVMKGNSGYLAIPIPRTYHLASPPCSSLLAHEQDS